MRKTLSLIIALLMFSVLLLPVNAEANENNNTGNTVDLGKLDFFFCTDGVENGGVVEDMILASYTIPSANRLVLTLTFQDGQESYVQEMVDYNLSKVNGQSVIIAGEGKVLTLTYDSATPLTSGEYVIDFCGMTAPSATQRSKITITVPENDNNGDNDDVGGAPDTFDAITVVGVVAAISATGIFVSKKKR